MAPGLNSPLVICCGAMRVSCNHFLFVEPEEQRVVIKSRGNELQDVFVFYSYVDIVSALIFSLAAL